MIDLRSDTVTKPTQEMFEKMFQAEVGDDVFGEDPSVNLLEKKCAGMFGMESAMYCPSGTMTNQIGLNILTNPYEEIICYKNSHIYKYEGGGVAGNSGLSFKLLDGHDGILNLEEIVGCINPDDIHFPITSVVELENTVNKGGGKCYTLNKITKISTKCRERGLKMHLDGARLFNALVATGDRAEDYGKCFDTISICLSKGLGAPVGSVLLGSQSLIKKARRVRKYFGGGMRQAGYMAAAGIYALENHVERLAEDHHRARILEEELKGISYVSHVKKVETNIVIFELQGGISTDMYLNKLKNNGVLAVPFGPTEIRLVTHLDFNDAMLDQSIEVFKKLSF